jgi:hypothetical protein
MFQIVFANINNYPENMKLHPAYSIKPEGYTAYSIKPAEYATKPLFVLWLTT